jgi:putative NADH-flavin reductase
VSKVLIIGASRGIGPETAKQALSRGHSVRALARSADRIGLSDPNLQKLSGNALDPDDVMAALKGIDVVVQALGISAGLGMVLGPVRLFSDATRILVPAMEGAGIRRLICVTGFGAGDSRENIGCLEHIPFQVFLGRAYDDKNVQECLIRNSQLDLVIVRPGVLTNGRSTGAYKVLDHPKSWRNGLISRADVADFIVRQIEDETYMGKTPVLVY